MEKLRFKTVWIVDGNYGDLIETKAAKLNIKEPMWATTEKYLVWISKDKAFSVMNDVNVFESNDRASDTLKNQRNRHKLFLIEQIKDYSDRLAEITD